MSTIAEELLRDEHEEGREEGRQEAQRLIAKALLSAGDSVEKVMTITGLSRAEVAALKAP